VKDGNILQDILLDGLFQGKKGKKKKKGITLHCIHTNYFYIYQLGTNAWLAYSLGLFI
jgi:hypothetical protein